MTLDRVRVAARTLRKSPGFSIVVIASLALAISLNTTLYAALDALIHPRVDIRDPASLYRAKFFGDYKRHVTNAQRDSLLRAGAPSIESFAWFNGPSFSRTQTLRVGSYYAEAPVAKIDREYFGVMSPRVIAGRTFIRDDENAETKPIVLGEALASRLVAPGANPLGATVFVDSVPYVVVGVLSKYADFPQQHSGFTSFSNTPSGGWVLGQPVEGEVYSRVIRVRPGVTRADLERDLAVVSARMAIAAGDSPRDDAFRVGGTTQEQVELAGLQLSLVFAVVAVLLVACANVANMQLARGIGRSRELALRAALGASRGRIVTHLLLESALLGAVGLLLGLVFTYWFGVALRASIPPSVGKFIVEPRISWRVMVFAVVATIGCIVLVGLVPAIRVSAVDPNEMLKGAAGTGATRRHRRQYGYLVVVEIGLALMLLCACAVNIESALRARSNYMGYDPAPLALGFTTTGLRVGDRRPRPEVFASVLDRVRGIPGVVDASVSAGGQVENSGISLADSSGVRILVTPGYGYRIVSPSFFRTMGLPIIAGRDFRDGERDASAVIIDEFTAKKLWPNANPIGAMIKFGDARSHAPFVRIVGVVGTYGANGEIKPINMADASGATIGNVYYLPSERDTVVASGTDLAAMVVARTNGDAVALATAMRRAGVLRAQSMFESMGIGPARAASGFIATLFILFAAIALALGAFGVYGVVAHSVAERRRELGVRIALGATSRDILHAVLRETVVIGLSGIAFGLLLVQRSLGPLQFIPAGGDIFDAPLFAAVAVFMFGVAALAAFIPARRATLVDPTESLRSE